MSPFENIIDDLEARFGLGAKAAPLMRELLLLITGSPGGLSGFIDKFRSAGLGHQVGAWLGNSTSPPLSPNQVERALGSDAVDTIARKVGLSGATTSEAIGYLAPKLVGQLTPNGVISSTLPSSVSDYLRSSVQSGARAVQSGARSLEQSIPPAALDTRGTSGIAPWILPLLALAALLGLGWHFLPNRSDEPIKTATPTITPPTTTTAPAPVVNVTPSRLAISNDNGVVTISGTVRDEAARNSILETMKATFGGNAVKGDITVDPRAAPTPWLTNLRAALEQMKTPGMHAVFSGTSVNLGGSVSDAERDKALNTLRTVFSASGLAVSEMDNVAKMVSESTNKALAALTSLGPNFKANDLLDALNKSIINFPTGSAEIPPVSRELLQQAAGKFKQLPGNTVVQIGGYTDNTGDPAANVQLSQQRADAVRNTLVQAGANANMLVAKGFGSANPTASNDTPEGRFQNRRIEYSLKQ
jgi:OmpA-OmpF porin, OOP family